MIKRTGSINLTLHFTPDELKPNPEPELPFYVTVNGHGISCAGFTAAAALQRAIFMLHQCGLIDG